ncbi:deoxyribodipyrimidine photo-lyase [Zymomonas mobilis]|uniref:Deoxyribodipyrimidine photo-lyase n=1 Tax=Zymomonas mobilis TaxID=542 RepID=A0A542W2I0_ZYMMB|nr:deoxyribodipyrimidine photo-lyase [Zymomonas mobilis]TQL17777.1 deoxyribodipyrimidine photo-lyase [Zymomonas mobilis]
MINDARPALIWFRHDLRLHDNAALTAAVQSGCPLICFYIDERPSGKLVTAADWWVNESLQALHRQLKDQGGALHLFRGDAKEILPEIVKQVDASKLFWNRRYDHAGKETDQALKQAIKATGIDVHSFPNNLLHEPWVIKNKSGQSFKLFSAYWRAVQRDTVIPKPLPCPEKWVFSEKDISHCFGYSEIALLEKEAKKTTWANKLKAEHSFGEGGAHHRLKEFIENDIAHYTKERDFPAKNRTSLLSAFLRTGQVSSRQIWHEVTENCSGEGASKFLAELCWRDFAWSLLWDYPDLGQQNLRPEFNKMPWRHDPDDLQRWKEGKTGYPFIDAGMRALWQTGLMPNRLRMVVASFLVKHLLIDWREGEKWFAQTLIDYDLASNAMNWQWVAGSGVESAPYFRIMNPILQSQKFDQKGLYIRQWVEELAQVSEDFIHTPWQANKQPMGYPLPIIAHAKGRDRALAAWKDIRNA